MIGRYESRLLRCEQYAEPPRRFKQYGTEDGTKEFPAENAACRSYDTCNGVRSDAAV